MVVRILRDIATSSRGTFIYLPSENKYYLLPFSFSLKDGIGAILKLFALRNSDKFSAECGIAIGKSLVEKIASYFSKFSNFRVLKDIPLTRFSTNLPDIDLIAVSYEPSLGFHFFIAEVKNSLPAIWAKDYLKSVGKKGFVDKAITQINKINEFMKTENGLLMLKDICQELFRHLDLKGLFPTGFCIILNNMIITSQSIGMFYPKLKLTIINEDILREILQKSDGDVNFIQFYLHHLHEALDGCYKILTNEVAINNINITYDSPSLLHILAIPQNNYLSTNRLEELEKESLRTGYRFIDNDFEEYLKSKSDLSQSSEQE
jgi:hypothetical protein